ncbi:MAG TPA: periplasmic heavy metal sensor [Stellaceae bacterium]|nr:periplasmic heavy metal sensor [Stellaceae bacterium]
MTAAAEVPGRAVWRERGLWAALALSVTLNVFVAGGLAWSMMRAPPPRLANEGPAERLLAVARTMDLTPDQRTALRTFGTTARGLSRELREANGPIMREMWAQMATLQPDAAAIQALNDKALENRRTYQHGMATNLMTFLATLTPDQRKTFTENAMPGPGRARPER